MLTPDPLGAFHTYGKRIFEYMRDTVEAVRASHDDEGGLGLRRPYDDKVGAFPCRSFNLGSQTVTIPHVDDKNLAYSWCSVTALGNFNPDVGGHLMLWDFNLAIRFPPGSTIMIPSALFIHSNAAIQKDETRYSIVQYAAGGLFRWARRGFMSEKEWLRRRAAQGAAKGAFQLEGGQDGGGLEGAQEEEECSWDDAANMFSTLDELMEKRACAASSSTA